MITPTQDDFETWKVRSPKYNSKRSEPNNAFEYLCYRNKYDELINHSCCADHIYGRDHCPDAEDIRGRHDCWRSHGATRSEIKFLDWAYREIQKFVNNDNRFKDPEYHGSKETDRKRIRIAINDIVKGHVPRDAERSSGPAPRHKRSRGS